jgi:lysophospholipase L1-like esterase
MGIAFSTVLFVLSIAGVEAIFYFKNKSVGQAAPFLFNRAALRPENQGIRQEGGTARMSFLDPHLGYAHGQMYDETLSEDGAVAGFVIFGDAADAEALRIIALGGSTTDPLDRGNWPKALQKILSDAGIEAVVYNGGVSGYSTNQELIKFIRDGLPLEPDIVLCLNGINDMGFIHSVAEHPMVHPYQDRLLRSIVESRAPAWLPNTRICMRRIRDARTPKLYRVEGINYGPAVKTTPGRQWARNVGLLHAVAEEAGVAHLSLLQPVLGVGNYYPTAGEYELLETADDLRRGKYRSIIRDFYGEAVPEAAKLDYCVDLSGAFAGRSGLYRDARHPNADGYRVIAEAVYTELQARGMLQRRAAGIAARAE